MKRIIVLMMVAAAIGAQEIPNPAEWDRDDQQSITELSFDLNQHFQRLTSMADRYEKAMETSRGEDLTSDDLYFIIEDFLTVAEWIDDEGIAQSAAFHAWDVLEKYDAMGGGRADYFRERITPLIEDLW